MRPTPALLLLFLTGCAHRYVPCNDTISCREQRLQRDAEFAKLVAKEPAVQRLEVEPVSRIVLVDGHRGLVYALDPELVALDLETGVERWRAKNVVGDSLWRVGHHLAASTQGARLPPMVAFIDPEQPSEPSDCRLRLAAPSEAEHVHLHLFDRAGQPYAYWVSSWTYDGGTPPGERQEERQRKAKACGIVKVDPRTCALHQESLADFTWDPPSGRPGPCELSPLMDLPAAAASAPKLNSVPAQLLFGTYRTTVKVILAREIAGCEEREKQTLEARNGAGTLLWKHALSDLQWNICGKP